MAPEKKIIRKPRASKLGKTLVVVESPSKAKTLQKYLGKEYVVKASVGHIKDLPKSKLGVDVTHDFKTDYQVIPHKEKVIEELQEASRGISECYLATDPDREGEAIAFHIQEELRSRGRKFHRVLIHSITKPSVLAALENPLPLNQDKYEAQQARRILDRLVGYKVSPILWDKVKRGLSAGRVQSVAVRLVVEREKEILAFQPQEYWEIEGLFSKEAVSFVSRLFKIDGKDPALTDRTLAETWQGRLQKALWRVAGVEQKERSRKPHPPFITSRLQQEASQKLGFSAKKTMTLAQQLYEGINLGSLGTHGLITYMRTDSVRTDPQALQKAREWISQTYGTSYLPGEPIFYAAKKNAQDAHEAIRPTSLEFSLDVVKPHLEPDAFRLYQLIWNRFLASQMAPALYDQTVIDLAPEAPTLTQKVVFRTTASVLKFPGFTALYLEDAGPESPPPEKEGTGNVKQLPHLVVGNVVECLSLTPSQHFTQPPARYNDATLIKDLEEKGIGRPSTYAAILSNIQEKEYVEKRQNRYYPSELGTVVTELLMQSFPSVLNTQFTAEMEAHLDAIEEGKEKWEKVLHDFWGPFEQTLETAKIQMKNLKQQEVPTSLACELCGKPMVIRWGRLGSFLSCSDYPQCKNAQDFQKNEAGEIVIIPKEVSDQKCEKCQSPMLVKHSKTGRFLACSAYPSCKSTQAIRVGAPCPLCGEGQLTERFSKRFRRPFYSCHTWPKCAFASWHRPLVKPCLRCQSPILVEKVTKRQGVTHCCPLKGCGYQEVMGHLEN